MSSNSNEQPTANRPPRMIVDAGGEYFLNPPPNLDLRQVVWSRAPGHYPPGHEAPLRHPEDRQQVVVYQQEQQMIPQQHQYMAPPIMQQEYPAPPMLPQQHMALQMHEQHPPVFQPQQYMVPMMPPQNVASGQGQWVPNAPSQSAMMPPQNVAFGPGHRIPNAPTMMPPWVVPGPQPVHDQYYGGYPPQQQHQVFESDLQYDVGPVPNVASQQPNVQRGRKDFDLDLQLGSRLVIKRPVKLESSLGSITIQADEKNPVFLTLCPETPNSNNTQGYFDENADEHETEASDEESSESDDEPSDPEDVQETENVEEPKVQLVNQEPTKQEPMEAETIKAQMTPEEPVQQPILPIVEDSVQQSIQQTPVTEEPVQQPKEQSDVESNQTAMETLNINDNVDPVFGDVKRTYAKMASQPRATQPAVVSSAQASTNQPPKPKQVHARAPEFVTQGQRPRQSSEKVAHKPPPQPLCKPDSNEWITVGTSSSGPSSRQEKPVFLLKAPQPKPTISDKVEEQETPQEEVKEPIAEAPKGSGFVPNIKKRPKKSTTPALSKAEKKARERADMGILENFQEENILPDCFDNYVGRHSLVRAKMVKDGFGVDCVVTSDFERSFLTYYVQNKDSDWKMSMEEVKKFLKKNMNARKECNTPSDEKLVQRYKIILENLSIVVVQDFIAICALHPSNPTQIFENEYFDLIFDPHRANLFLTHLPKEIQAAPRNEDLQEFDTVISNYAHRQNRIRANYDRLADGQWFEDLLISYYILKKKILDGLLENSRDLLVEKYYTY